MAAGFFGKLLGGGSGACVGIDIGTTSIKMAELEFANGTSRLINYGTLETLGHLERANVAFQASSLKLFERDIVRYVTFLAEKSGIRSRRAVATLPSFAVFSTLLDLPPMPEAEIAQALQFKARQYIPLPISAVSLDWVRVAERKVLLLAIPNDLIAKYKSIFAAAGFTLAGLEVEGVSMARSLTALDEAGAGAALIIDIGSRSTGIFAAEQGVLQLAGQTDFSGSSLTHGIAAGLSIAERRAEGLKRERGLVNVGFGAHQELSTLLFPLVDAILDEAKRLRERYVSSYGKDVTRVILSGGGANMPGLEGYVSERFGIPAAHAAPYRGISHSSQAEATLVPLGPCLSVALGAALRTKDGG